MAFWKKGKAATRTHGQGFGQQTRHQIQKARNGCVRLPLTVVAGIAGVHIGAGSHYVLAEADETAAAGDVAIVDTAMRRLALVWLLILMCLVLLVLRILLHRIALWFLLKLLRRLRFLRWLILLSGLSLLRLLIFLSLVLLILLILLQLLVLLALCDGSIFCAATHSVCEA